MASIQAQRKNELFSELEEHIMQELVKLGLAEESAEQSAEAITFNIYENWRGLSVVFPMQPKRYMDRLKKRILSEFNGRNSTEIVRKYKISENILYRWNRESLHTKKCGANG